MNNKVHHESICLNINESGLLANMKFAFAGKDSIVVELIQNARRAGASRIEVTVNAIDLQHSEIIVRDDGCGIDNFGKLLTVAESGWDAATKMEETPYGMGWLSCLYAAERVRIESKELFLDVPTSDLLAMKHVIPAALDNPIHGTCISLWRVRISSASLELKVRQTAKGYDCPIFLNGELLESKDAVRSRTGWIQTPIGLIWMPDDFKNFRCEHRYYLQGIFMGTSDRYSGAFDNQTIVHLDPTKFFGRMPDRDVLIDRDEAIAMVEQQLKQYWRSRITQWSKSVPAEDFVSTLWICAAKLGGLDMLLNEIPLFPASLCYTIFDVPHCSSDSRESWRESHTMHLGKENLANGGMRIIDQHREPECYDPSERDAIENVYLASQRFVSVDLSDVPTTHWIRDRVEDLSSWTPSITVVNRCDAVRYRGPRDADVYLADHYIIHHEKGDVVVADVAIVLDNGICIPKDWCSDAARALLLRMWSYEGENEEWLDDALDEDAAAFSSIVDGLRGASPVQILNRQINGWELHQQPALKGEIFVIGIRDEYKEYGYVKTISLADFITKLSSELVGRVSESELLTIAGSQFNDLTKEISQH